MCILSVKPTRCAWKSHAINCTALASIPKHTNTVYYKHTVKGIFTQNKNDPMIYYPSSHPRCIWLSSFGFFLSHPFRGPLLITQSVCGVQGLKKKKILSLNFFPGWGFGCGGEHIRRVIWQTKNNKIIWMIFHETKAQTTEIVLFKINNGKLNTRKVISNRKYTKTVYYSSVKWITKQ